VRALEATSYIDMRGSGSSDQNHPELVADVLDEVRGVVWSHANRSQDYLVPVSSSLVHFALKRRGRPWLPSEPLRALAHVKDVQGLGDGFWLPVATSLVPAGDIFIVCSGLPTSALTLELSLVPSGFGSSRLLYAPVDLPQLPRRALADWLEAPESTVLWTKKQLESVRFQDPFGLEGMDAFRHWKGPGSRRWLRIESADLPPHDLILARHKAPSGATNHYLLRMEASQVIGMHELPHDGDLVRRMQIGLRNIAEDPERFFLMRSGDTLFDLVTPPIPHAERRLLEALGPLQIDPDTGQLRVRMPERATNAACQVLTALGLELRSPPG
jgi:hypothetical protein